MEAAVVGPIPIKGVWHEPQVWNQKSFSYYLNSLPIGWSKAKIKGGEEQNRTQIVFIVVFAHGTCRDPTHFCAGADSCGAQVEWWVLGFYLIVQQGVQDCCWEDAAATNPKSTAETAAKIMCKNNVQSLALLILNFSSSFSPASLGKLKWGIFQDSLMI